MVDHYIVVLDESGIPSGITGDFVVTTTGTSANFLVHRAERTYYGKVFACDDPSDCSSSHLFGSDPLDIVAPGSGDDDLDTAATEQEVWVVTDVTPSGSGASNYVIKHLVSGGCATPSVFFYPSGWTNAGKLALYCHKDTALKMMVTTGTGWQAFNDQTSSPWSSPTTFGHSTDGTDYTGCSGADDFDAVDHLYPAPVVDGSGNKFVRLLAQNQGTADHKHVVSIDSTDQTGDDFDLGSTTYCTCTAGSDCDWPAAGGEVAIYFAELAN